MSSQKGRERPKGLKYFWSIWHHYLLSSDIFLEEGACVSLTLATKVVLRGKKISETLSFLIAFLKLKRFESEKVWNGVATKGFLRAKNILKIYIFRLFL